MSVLVLLFPFAMLLAAFCDLLSMTIPNRIPAALGVAFLVLAPLAGLGPAEMGLHLAAGLAALLFCFACFAAGWMGGGDAKLLAATVLWLGPGDLFLQYVALSAMLGGALTLLLLQARTMIAPATGIDFVDRLMRPETGVPYGIALGLAGLVVYPATPFFAFLAGA